MLALNLGVNFVSCYLDLSSLFWIIMSFFHKAFAITVLLVKKMLCDLSYYDDFAINHICILFFIFSKGSYIFKLSSEF